MTFMYGVIVASIACGIGFAFMVLTFAGNKKGWW
jgi:hypothetical protein